MFLSKEYETNYLQKKCVFNGFATLFVKNISSFELFFVLLQCKKETLVK